jgi:hypothetical protein
MRKMQRLVLVGLVMVLLTLAFASSVYAGPPDPGSCPRVFVLGTGDGQIDRNGDGYICYLQQPGGHLIQIVTIDNNVGGPPE